MNDTNKKARFKCFLRTLKGFKETEVWADSSYQAQLLAAQEFGITKHLHKIDVVLCFRPNGSQVEHTPCF